MYIVGNQMSEISLVGLTSDSGPFVMDPVSDRVVVFNVDVFTLLDVLMGNFVGQWWVS